MQIKISLKVPLKAHFGHLNVNQNVTWNNFFVKQEIFLKRKKNIFQMSHAAFTWVFYWLK